MNVQRLRKLCLALLLLSVLAISVLTLVACSDESGSFEVKIVHTNDVHARVEEDDEVIGAERLKTIIDSHFKNSDLGLALDSGDLLHGQSIATLVKGESIAKLIKACGYDAMVSGNHDWNYGKSRLAELSAIAELPVLAGNVVKDDGSRFFEKEFLIKEVKKGNATLRIGIIGMIGSEVYSDTAPFNVEGISFSPAEEYAKDVSARLREEEDCDIVIALAHMENPTSVAERVDGVDIWLCGHDHVDIDKGVNTPDGTVSYVFENTGYMSRVGLIDMSVDMDKDGAVTAVRIDRSTVTYESASEYGKDTDVSDLLSEIKSGVDTVLDQVVGKNPVDLDGERQNVRTSQTNLGTAVASAYLLETGADIAFENSGGIRASLAAGDVTYGDIIDVSPFGNYLVTKRISGRDILEVMELSLDFRAQTLDAYADMENFVDPGCSGTSLQVAGMEMKCDMTKAKGSRVISITVGGQALEYDKLYIIAVSNYVGTTSEYTAIAEAEELGQFSACEEALIKFFSREESEISEAVAENPVEEIAE